MSDIEGFWATVQCICPPHPYHPREPDYGPLEYAPQHHGPSDATLLVIERHRSAYWKAMAGSYEAQRTSESSGDVIVRERAIDRQRACRAEAREALEMLSALGALP